MMEQTAEAITNACPWCEARPVEVERDKNGYRVFVCGNRRCAFYNPRSEKVGK